MKNVRCSDRNSITELLAKSCYKCSKGPEVRQFKASTIAATIQALWNGRLCFGLVRNGFDDLWIVGWFQMLSGKDQLEPGRIPG